MHTNYLNNHCNLLYKRIMTLYCDLRPTVRLMHRYHLGIMMIIYASGAYTTNCNWSSNDNLTISITDATPDPRSQTVDCFPKQPSSWGVRSHRRLASAITMPLLEKVLESFSGTEAERMMTADPIRYMENIKTSKDPQKNACLLHFLTHIQDKQWLLLRNAGIMEFVEQAIQSPLAISKVCHRRFDRHKSCRSLSYRLMRSMPTRYA